MSGAMIQDLSDRDWEQKVEQNPLPVLVMFFSPDCRHCAAMAPHFEKNAADFSDRISFVRLNVMQYNWIAERYGVLATPTFIYFCGGKPVQTRVGAVFPAMIKKMAEEMVEHGEECRIRSTEIKYEISGYG
jgi:thioredoxin-like negative regulator of GroEL